MSKIFLSPNQNLLAAIEAIERSMTRMVVVCDEKTKLLGTLTDGDIRRCLLRGGSLQTNVCEAMNKNPIFAKEGSSQNLIFDMMRKNNVFAVPIVNHNNIFTNIVDIKEIASGTGVKLSNNTFECAVIMAGGLGSRLRPLTINTPKPMIEVGGIPLLERQIKLIRKFGIRKVFLSVNYLSYVIQEYFKDGSDFDVEIKYLEEKNNYGTAGSLSLMPKDSKGPFLVLNGDILTNSNLNGLFEFHKLNKANITIASVDYKVAVPYGTLKVQDMNLVALEEKPNLRFLCNAGIYVLERNCLDYIPNEEKFNMTDLIDSFLGLKKKVSVFPLYEYWSDIGTLEDLEKARECYKFLN